MRLDLGWLLRRPLGQAALVIVL
ncbi:MAG: hypothetical protein RLZZ246_480, partial [Planctomycetota bacterium]